MHAGKEPAEWGTSSSTSRSTTAQPYVFNVEQSGRASIRQRTAEEEQADESYFSLNYWQSLTSREYWDIR
jgi:hypothetical protein